MIKRWREHSDRWQFGLTVWRFGIRAWFGPWSWVVKWERRWAKMDEELSRLFQSRDSQ